MSSRAGWPAVAAVLFSGCATNKHAANTPPPPMPQAMQRQIANAIDLGDGDVQTQALRRQVVAVPEDLEARLDLAARYAHSGAPELAIEHYRCAAERFPRNPRVALLLASALRDRDRSGEALVALEQFRARNARPPAELLSLLGILRDDAGQFQEAERVYRTALEQYPDRADLRNNLGYNLLLQARAAEAVQEFQQALKAEPRSQIAHNNLGVALLAQWKDDKQPEQALLHWQSVSDPASAHNNLAAILMEQKRYRDARKELEIALSYRGDHAAALRNLKLVAELDGQPANSGPYARPSFWKRVKTAVFNPGTPASAGQPSSAVEAARTSR